ncbi:MAG: M28 family peptidase [Chloroflexota bacterium]|nr:M28 family peptidase [Chloroflexota bacterium]
MATLFDAVSGSELDRHLRVISRVVRLSGTPEEAQAFDYIASELQRFGYQVSRYESDALAGYPGRASLDLLDPEPATIQANGYSLSPGTGPDGITAALVHAGSGMPEDYAGLDVAAKIVLTDGLAMPAKAMAAAAAGAVGQIHINDEYIHEMCLSPVWGTPTPETAGLLPSVPSIGITRPDGDRLMEALGQGPVRVRLVTEPFLDWVKLPTLTADLPGTAEDGFVLFSGHVDSWHHGAMDNGTANATQLEVARLLAERRGDLRRGVRLAFWSGHSHARYAGSAWYADTFWHELHERCVCHVNVDSVGAVGATVLEEAPTMAETHGFARQVLADTVGAELDYKRISRSSDQSFWGHGIPTVFASLSEQERDDSATGAALAQLLGGGGKGGGLGWWWHTTEDTVDKIDPANLVRDAGVYAETLWQLCTLERLPFDPAAAAAEMAEHLDRYHEAAAGTVDLAGTRDLARDLATALRAGNEMERGAEEANRRIMALCRLLIPVNYTRSGPFEHDLALGTRPLPGLAEVLRLPALDRSGDEFQFLRTKLIRERNRVEHALRAALRVADSG